MAHLDLDAFFAAVEMHRRPELRGRPMAVGGDPDGRGVVATANYAARRFGVRSAMSCAEARRRCPALVFVRPDIGEYRAWSERVWATVGGLVPVCEPVGLDEGYLDLGEDDPIGLARRVQRAVADDVRLSASLGVATCKVVAKIASDRDKPGGLTVVPRGGERAFLSPLAVRLLPGAGPRTTARLLEAGVETIGDLAELPQERVAALIPGRVGELLRDRARGVDPRPVVAEPPERISVSTERTFDRDVSDRAELARRGQEMARDVASSLSRRGRCARTVTVKLRYGDFSTVTRSHTMAAATDDAGAIWRMAWHLLETALEERPGPLRLLGVGASGLSEQHQLALF
ncbi:MAG: DNA polymerase IV [Thermoleophilia bacterium]